MLLRHLYAIAGLIAILTTLSLSTAHVRASARMDKPSPVIVQNTAATPVPTVAQGTTTVGGTVAVSSLPAVQIAGGQSVGINGSVALANGTTVNLPYDSNNPLPVRDVDLSSRTPITVVFAQLTFPDGHDYAELEAVHNDFNGYTVPAGKLLAITNVFGHASLAAGQTVVSALLGGDLPMQFVDHGAEEGVEVLDVNQPTAYYLSGGNTIRFGAGRSGTAGDGDIYAGFSGYLENE